jgi:hypothetical protein
VAKHGIHAFPVIQLGPAKYSLRIGSQRAVTPREGIAIIFPYRKSAPSLQECDGDDQKKVKASPGGPMARHRLAVASSGVPVAPIAFAWVRQRAVV